MLATWTISDGTEIVWDASGVAIRGASLFAEWARLEFAAATRGTGAMIETGLPDSPAMPLDARDPKLVRLWIGSAARRVGLTVLREALWMMPTPDEDPPSTRPSPLGMR